MNIRERTANDLDSIRMLLEAEGLPFNGIERTRGWVAEESGRVVSHIAIEEAADVVVLRSLVTAPEAQGRGIARKLMDIAESEAGERALLLRTKTVGPWVLRRGYALMSPDQLPQGARGTSEFEGTLCSGVPIYAKREGGAAAELGGFMTPAVTELAAISAAMAANCEPCFKFHFDKARKLGVSREDIRKAVQIGLSVKAAPHRKVVETAERFLAGEEREEKTSGSCAASAPPKSSCGCGS